jgi:hypothetical protein
MSLAVFLPFLFHGMSDRIQENICQVLDFSFFGRLFIAASIYKMFYSLYAMMLSDEFKKWQSER